MFPVVADDGTEIEPIEQMRASRVSLGRQGRSPRPVPRGPLPYSHAPVTVTPRHSAYTASLNCRQFDG